MSSKKLIVPITEHLPHTEAQRKAAEYCKNAHLPEFRFSSETMQNVLLYNLDHPDHNRMRNTDKRIHASAGIGNIWIASSHGTQRRKQDKELEKVA